MKYITFLKTKQNLNIYNILGSYLPDIESITSLDDKNLYIGIVKDDFNFSNLTEESINFFNIKIHTIEQLREFVNNNSDYPLKIAAGSPDIFNISQPKSFDCLTDHNDKNYCPHDSWVWNDQFGHWTPPIEKPKLSTDFKITWNQNRLNWDIDLLDFPENRTIRSYALWNAIPKVEGNMYAEVCSANNFMMQSMQELNNNDEYMKQQIEYGRSMASSGKYHGRMITMLDLCPYAFIIYHESIPEYVEKVGHNTWQKHPHIEARTIHELFRVIIEWDWAYTQLGNREPAAQMCNDIVRILDIPQEVINELMNMQPQAVSKFISNDETALQENSIDPECPIEFKYWIMSQYIKFPRREKDEKTHIKE